MRKEEKRIDEKIEELKEQLHKYDKAIARIQHWHDRLGHGTEASEAREAEWKTLETVLRIFKVEGVN